MLLSKRIVILILFSGFGAEAKHDKPIKVGTYLTPGIISEDGSGLFNKLNKLVFKHMDHSFELLIQPINRVKHSFSVGEVDVYFPELHERLPKNKSDYVISSPIFYKRIILFTRKDADFSSLEDIGNRYLGAVSDYSYGQKIKNDSSLNVLYQTDDLTNIRLLVNGRLDAVLGGFPGTVLAVNESAQKDLIHYDLNKPVAVLESFYVCPNSQAGIALCEKINNAVTQLQEKGILLLDAKTGISKLYENGKANINGND